MEFTHLNNSGYGRMVDVSDKEPTYRVASAQGCVYLNNETINMIKEGIIKKGDVLNIAQTAGIMAAKKTSFIIPLCHNINLTFADILYNILPERIIIRSLVKTKAETGVEMEALNAVSACALTIYDMCKSVQKNISISDIYLLYKDGGKSGKYILPQVSNVCISEQRGTVKRSVPYVELKKDFGIISDAHAGNWHRQVSLLSKESTAKIENIKLEAGIFAENILTEGICFDNIKIGSILKVGEVSLEVTQIGKECHNSCTVKEKTGKCVMPTDGIFTRVLTDGFIYSGCKIIICS